MGHPVRIRWDQLSGQGGFFNRYIQLLVSGCTFPINPEYGPVQRVTIASADQMLDPSFEGFTDEQLLQLLDPIYNGASLEKNIKNESNNETAEGKEGKEQNNEELMKNQLTKSEENILSKEYSNLTPSEKEKALRYAFRNANQNNKYGVPHRSQIQDRLIAASNQRCNIYTTYLKRVNTNQNAILGTLTTVLGGAGAIVTGENSSRLLSGLAGITSGTRAELNQTIFESVATSVIIPGIQNKRNEILTSIMAKRSKSLSEYTIEGAIADAIIYHGACSIDAGIAFAQKSIQSYEDIGVNKLSEIQNKLNITRSLSETFTLPSIDTLTVCVSLVEDQLSNLKSKHQKTIDALENNKEDHNKIIILYNNLLNSLKKDGDLRKEAEKIDTLLTSNMLAYVSSKGVEKTENFSKLEAQQIDARSFERKLDAKITEFLYALSINN